jgi:hypothetical protein
MTEYFGGKRVQSARQRTATASAKIRPQKKPNDSVLIKKPLILTEIEKGGSSTVYTLTLAYG